MKMKIRRMLCRREAQLRLCGTGDLVTVWCARPWSGRSFPRLRSCRGEAQLRLCGTCDPDTSGCVQLLLDGSKVSRDLNNGDVITYVQPRSTKLKPKLKPKLNLASAYRPLQHNFFFDAIKSIMMNKFTRSLSLDLWYDTSFLNRQKVVIDGDVESNPGPIASAQAHRTAIGIYYSKATFLSDQTYTGINDCCCQKYEDLILKLSGYNGLTMREFFL